MDYTKKIMYQSNSWYNDGLRKAQVRDMSGAIVSLQQSLQYNRENIAARNLLGLVYYGIGEVSEALVEWIISKNLCPRDNIADYYIKKVQNSANELESLNQAIKKFNQCLVYCQQNGEDLAIIQLKQVIASHPTFLKAYQLLALIYIQMNQNTKARQILIEAKKLDTTNELTLTYLQEVTKQRGRYGKNAERSFRKPKSATVEYSLGNETIIQPKRSKIRDMAQQLAFANILIGMVLGAALIWFLVAPAVNQNRSEKLNNQMAELDVATSENNIQESITQVYIQILYAAESVKVNENTLQVSIAQRDRGQELLNAGSIAKSDLAQLEAQVSTDRYQLVTAQATLQDYKLQLKQLLELDGENEMNVYLPALSDENVLLPLPTKKDVYMSALTLRPEIEASKLSVEASELGIDIAKAGYLPTISLSAGIGTNHTSGSDFTFGEQVKNGWNNSIGVSVSVPIFNNRQTKSAVQKAKLQRETSLLSLLDEQKTLYKTIEGLWLDANSAQQRYAAANEKLKSTQISYDLISEQFNLGMKNTVELLTEKNNLLQAQQEQLQAKYMAILNTQLLKFYQGDKLAL